MLFYTKLNFHLSTLKEKKKNSRKVYQWFAKTKFIYFMILEISITFE